MKKLAAPFLLCLLFQSFLAPATFALTKKKHTLVSRDTDSYASDPFDTVGHWIASGGMGLTISPTTFLLNPQLEYVIARNITVGPMIQLGLANAVLFAFTGAVRYTFNQDAKIKPSIEGGLGLAVSSGFASTVGVDISIGMGCDYVITRRIRVGTMIRGNFAPPLKTFYLSWPIVVGRFAL